MKPVGAGLYSLQPHGSAQLAQPGLTEASHNDQQMSRQAEPGLRTTWLRRFAM
jgi:hypothetical protein